MVWSQLYSAHKNKTNLCVFKYIYYNCFNEVVNFTHRNKVTSIKKLLIRNKAKNIKQRFSKLFDSAISTKVNATIHFSEAEAKLYIDFVLFPIRYGTKELSSYVFEIFIVHERELWMLLYTVLILHICRVAQYASSKWQY